MKNIFFSFLFDPVFEAEKKKKSASELMNHQEEDPQQKKNGMQTCEKKKRRSKMAANGRRSVDLQPDGQYSSTTTTAATTTTTTKRKLKKEKKKKEKEKKKKKKQRDGSDLRPLRPSTPSPPPLLNNKETIGRADQQLRPAREWPPSWWSMALMTWLSLMALPTAVPTEPDSISFAFPRPCWFIRPSWKTFNVVRSTGFYLVLLRYLTHFYLVALDF